MIFMFIGAVALVKGVTGVLDWVHEGARDIREERVCATLMAQEKQRLLNMANGDVAELEEFLKLNPIPVPVFNRRLRRCYLNKSHAKAVQGGNAQALLKAVVLYESHINNIEYGEVA